MQISSEYTNQFYSFYVKEKIATVAAMFTLYMKETKAKLRQEML